MELLSDLTTLSLFEGSRVPAAPLNGMCMSLFGQLLTHPSRVTFPWSALRHALNSYFASPPHLIDPAKIGSGWNGLSLILTSFKRLEVVQSPEETEEVLLWLTNLKAAAVKRSLQFEITAQPTLEDILANLLEPVSEEELAIGRARQTHQSKPINSIPSAAAMVYDPFALEDLSNAAPRKRTANSTSIDTSASHKRSRASYGGPSTNGAENDALGEDDDAESRKRGKAASANSRRAATTTTSSSRRASTGATADSKASVAATQRFVEPTVVPTSSPAASSTSSRSRPPSKKPSSQKVVMVDGPDGVPIKKVTRIQRPHDPNRPNFSYSALIGQAILNAPEKRLRLSEIYDYVTNNYSYYKKNECGWQNSIRHNLSLQPVFKKIPDHSIPGKKGCFWTIIPSEEWRFAGGGWTKLEKGQGSPVGGHHHPHKKGKKAAAHQSSSPISASKRKLAVAGGAEPMDEDDEDEEGDGAMYDEDED